MNWMAATALKTPWRMGRAAATCPDDEPPAPPPRAASESRPMRRPEALAGHWLESSWELRCGLSVTEWHGGAIHLLG